MNNELLTTDLRLLSSVFCPLHLSRALYKSALFMQNKPNLLNAQMNISSVLTRDYENNIAFGLRKNKPNTKPIKANFRKAKMNVTTFLTKEYENISNCSLAENKPNTKPIQTQLNPILSAIALAKADSNSLLGMSYGENYVL